MKTKATPTAFKTHLRLFFAGGILLATGAPVIGQVTNLSDGGTGSLRQAIADATAGSTITLTNIGTFILTNELGISKDLTIAGPGADLLAISGNTNSRVFNIASNVTVTLSGLTIRNGRSPAGGTAAPGQNGGGVYNAGTLSLINCVVSNNAAGNGGSGINGGTDASGSPGGAGGHGGGIYNSMSGAVTLDACTVVGNSGGWGGRGGNGGHGYSSTGLFGGAGHNGGAGGSGGHGGAGGGVYSDGTMVLNQCLLSANVTGRGGAGGNGGGGGDSGTFYYGRNGGNGGTGGRGGDGGCIQGNGSIFITNCTVSANRNENGGTCGVGGHAGSGGMGSGSGGAAGAGGSGGSGGGLNNNGNLRLSSLTIAYNTTGAGGAGNPTGATGTGGGILNRPGAQPAELVNTIVAGNIHPASGSDDVYGAFTSLGHNLIGNSNASTGFGASGDLLGVDAMLGSLADNGGPTHTHSPLPGSPIVNAGDNLYATTTDQRGWPRIMGGTIDIGALELQGLPLATTLPASQIVSAGTNASALLSGTVNPEGVETVVWFEWGTSTNYGQFTSPAGAGAGGQTLMFTNSLQDLAAGEIYHYRIAGSNSLGTAYGVDQQIATLRVDVQGEDTILHVEGTPFTDPGYEVFDPTRERAAAVAAGPYHSLAIKANGDVVQWGYNFGSVPPGATNAMAIAAGAYHSLAVQSNGTVVQWGSVPQAIPANATNVTAVAASQNYNLALKADGTIVEWGQTPMESIPGSATNVIAVAAGFDEFGSFTPYGMALEADGSVVQWGFIWDSVPASATNVVAIAAGGSMNLALKDDGTIVQWGMLIEPVPSDATNVVAIAAGASAGMPSCLALKADGTVVQWGYIVGNVPSSAENVVRIAAGGTHNLALEAGGGIIAWGSNSYGQNVVPAALAPLIVTVAGSVDVNVAGVYELTYTVTNSLGAVGWDTRTVVVMAAPAVATLPATGIVPSETGTRATFNGTINPNGTATTAWFEWGTTPRYGQTAGWTNVGSASSSLPLSWTVTNLTAGMTYH